MKTATAVATVLMSEEEARSCVSRIREGMENVRALLLDLHEREGWRALGYGSFVECAESEFDASKTHAYRLLDAARIDQMLSPMGENLTPIPERQAREMAIVANDPDTVREVYTEVLVETDGKPTAGAVRKAVDRKLGRQPSTKPATERRSVSSSGAQASDFVDDAPAYDSQDAPDDAVIVSNEPMIGGPRERFCSDCGDRYIGAVCPCSQQLPAEASAENEYPLASDQPCTACGGEIMLQSEQDDRALAKNLNDARLDGREASALCDACLTGEQSAAPTNVQPEPAKTEYQPASRTSSAGLGNQRVAPAATFSGPPPLTIRGDAADALRAVEGRYAISAIGEGMTEAFNTQQLVSLAAQIIDSLPAASVEPLAHRVNVRVKPATAEPAAPSVPSTANLADWEQSAVMCLTPGSRVALIARLVNGLGPKQEDAVREMLNAREAARLERERLLGSKAS